MSSTNQLPARHSGKWPGLIRNYEIARAKMELAYATTNDETAHTAASDAHSAALEAMLLMPAECLADIRTKIAVVNREKIDEDCWCCREIIALLAVDADRLMPFGREQGA